MGKDLEFLWNDCEEFHGTPQSLMGITLLRFKPETPHCELGVPTVQPLRSADYVKILFRVNLWKGL